MAQDTPPEGAETVLPFEKFGRMYQLLGEHEELHKKGKRHPHGKARELDDLLSQAGGHQRNGRIPLKDAEHAAVDKLLASHDASASLTRRDPGETGPVVVEIDGVGVWHIDKSGKTTKQKAGV